MVLKTNEQKNINIYVFTFCMSAPKYPCFSCKTRAKHLWMCQCQVLAPAFVVVVVAIVGTRVASVTDDFLEGLRSACCGIGCEQTCFWPFFFFNPFDGGWQWDGRGGCCYCWLWVMVMWRGLGSLQCLGSLWLRRRNCCNNCHRSCCSHWGVLIIDIACVVRKRRCAMYGRACQECCMWSTSFAWVWQRSGWPLTLSNLGALLVEGWSFWTYWQCSFTRS